MTQTLVPRSAPIWPLQELVSGGDAAASVPASAPTSTQDALEPLQIVLIVMVRKKTDTRRAWPDSHVDSRQGRTRTCMTQWR